MSDREGQGFVIRDRRGGTDPSKSPASDPGPSTSTKAGAPAEPTPEPPSGSETAPPLSFSAFVFSLGTSALMLLGEQLDPQQPKPPVSLAQAKEIIDILSLLEEKTRGNLTSEEQAVLGDMLYALRMKYVDVASGKPEAKSP